LRELASTHVRYGYRRLTVMPRPSALLDIFESPHVLTNF
jgi:hypothetical protein